MVLKHNNLPELTDKECSEIERVFGKFDETKPVRTYTNGKKVIANFFVKSEKRKEKE